jgi:uncharacterized membrane protein
MGINWAEHTVEITAPIETCFDAIVDYESFPGWQSAVQRIEVQSRDETGLGKQVRLYLSAKGQKVDYTLDYAYERPHEIRWDFVEGNGVKDVDGTYRFESLGEGRTRATYKLGIDPSLPVPGIVARRIHSGALRKSVEELKDEAERRHREQPAPTPPEPAQAEAPDQPTPADPPAQPASAEPSPDLAPADLRATPARPEAAPDPVPATAGTAESSDPEPALGAATSVPQTAAKRAGGVGSATERAVSLGREVAGDSVRAGLNLAGGALAVARGAAGAGVELARGVAGVVVDRTSSEVRRRGRR